MSNRPRWTPKENQILSELYPSALKTDILSAIPSKTWEQIKKTAQYRGLSLGRSNYTSDLSPLLGRIPEALYWMGFLCADGHFDDHSVVLEIAKKDEEHLLKFCKFIKYPIESVYRRTRNNFGGSFNQVSLRATHSEIVSQLKDQYAISSQKTKYPISLNHLNQTELLYFLIGFIDGDGSISKRRTTKIISIEINEKWEPVLSLFRDTLIALGQPMRAKVLLYTRKDTGQTFCRWQIVNSEVHAFLKRLTIDAKLPVLTRKWDIL